MRRDAWSPIAAVPPLGVDEVHVWAIPLDLDDETLRSLGEELAEDEQRRAAAFHAAAHRARFVAGRGSLRRILAGYAGEHAARIRFRYSPAGKPELDPATDLRFNLSHSDALAVLAVTCGREVGVDVERVREDLDFGKIAERFLSEEENEELSTFPPESRHAAFFRCWTRREARLKSRGAGVFGSPHVLDGGTPGWRLCELAPTAGYVGAVTAEGVEWRLECWTWAQPGAIAPARSATP